MINFVCNILFGVLWINESLKICLSYFYPEFCKKKAKELNGWRCERQIMTYSTLESRKKKNGFTYMYVEGSDGLWWGFSLTFFMIWYYLEINYNALEDFTSISSNYFKCIINPFLIDTMFIALSTFNYYYR